MFSEMSEKLSVLSEKHQRKTNILREETAAALYHSCLLKIYESDKSSRVGWKSSGAKTSHMCCSKCFCFLLFEHMLPIVLPHVLHEAEGTVGNVLYMPSDRFRGSVQRCSVSHGHQAWQAAEIQFIARSEGQRRSATCSSMSKYITCPSRLEFLALQVAVSVGIKM